MKHADKQLDYMAAVEFFYLRSGARAVVVLANDPGKLIGQLPPDMELFVIAPWLQKKRRSKQLTREFPKLQFITAGNMTSDFLANKMFICLPESARQLRGGNYSLQSALHDALISINLAPKSGSTPDEASLSGVTRHSADSDTKDTDIAIDGKLLRAAQSKAPLLPVLAIMHIYNERDIIAATINHLLDEDVDVHIIDNWSNDGTYEIVQKLAQKSKRVTFERFPEKDKGVFELAAMLRHVASVAKSRPEYKWVMLNDADEFRWSPWPGVNLRQALSFVDAAGYNALDYTVFNFIPTKEGFSEHQNPLTFFTHGEFSTVSGHFVQIKTWRNAPDAELASSGGHHVAFDGQRVFPLKFLLCHYPFRSMEHAQTKVFTERKNRYATAERKKGWHTQYDNMEQGKPIPLSNGELLHFNRDAFYQEHILELLSGVGIKRDA